MRQDTHHVTNAELATAILIVLIGSWMFASWLTKPEPPKFYGCGHSVSTEVTF